MYLFTLYSKTIGRLQTIMNCDLHHLRMTAVVPVAVVRLTARYRVQRVGSGRSRSGSCAGRVRVRPEYVPDVRLARIAIARSSSHRKVERLDALFDSFGMASRKTCYAGRQFGGC